MSKHITIYYGPVDSLNLGISHKPQFVYGLRDRLRRLGYRVDLRPVQYLNYCMLEISGYEVFRCNIKYLAFNMPYKKDPICQLAVKAVKKSEAMFTKARHRVWLKQYLMKQMFKNSKYKEHWCSDVELEEMDDFKTCAEECCRILYHKNPDVQELKSQEENLEPRRKSHDEAYFDEVSMAFTHRSSHLFFLPTDGDTKDLKQRKFEYSKYAAEKGLMSQLNIEDRGEDNTIIDNQNTNDIKDVHNERMIKKRIINQNDVDKDSDVDSWSVDDMITDIIDHIISKVGNIVKHLHFKMAQQTEEEKAEQTEEEEVQTDEEEAVQTE